MKLLVVGGGGREHAIIKKIKENKSVEKIYALPGNAGMRADAICIDISPTDLESSSKRDICITGKRRNCKGCNLC